MGLAPFKDSIDPFTDQMRMATTMTITLNERYMLVIDNLIFKRKVCNLFRKHPIGVRNDDNVEVISGLGEGDTAIWNDTQELTDGMNVRLEKTE